MLYLLYLIYFMKASMKKYSTLWTQFETQALAYGLLRKALYPKHLVRGEAGRILVYKATEDHNRPIFLFSIDVHASTTKEEDRFTKIDDGRYLLVGGQSAFNVVMHVIPELIARAEGSNAVPSPV